MAAPFLKPADTISKISGHNTAYRDATFILMASAMRNGARRRSCRHGFFSSGHRNIPKLVP
jgi:hypothetical protein